MSAGTVKILERFGLFSKKLPDSPGSYTRAARGDCPTTEIIICVSPPYGRGNTKSSPKRTLLAARAGPWRQVQKKYHLF